MITFASIAVAEDDDEGDHDDVVGRVGDHEEKDRDVVEVKWLGARLPGEETLLCTNSGVHPHPRRQAGLKDCQGECDQGGQAPAKDGIELQLAFVGASWMDGG